MINAKTKVKMIIINVILLMFLFILNLLIKYLELNVQSVNINNFSIRVILLTNCLFVINSFKIKNLNIGINLLNLSFLIEILIEFNVTLLASRSYSIIINSLHILGLLFILHGMISVLNRLIKLAYYDKLTGLPNRNYLFSKCSNNACEDCNFLRSCIKYERAALLHINLNEFKIINDYTGHLGGDTCLKVISERLRSIMSTEDFIYRMSGDEFIIIINNKIILNDIKKMLISILTTISQPIFYKDKEIFVSSSIGVAFYPEHGENLQVLMKKADISMNQARKITQNNYYIFEERLEFEFNTHYEIVSDLKNAIKNKEFCLFYQPKADLKTNEITGLEALIRWNHPTKGMVFPNQFIPIAEKVKLISQIDMMVLELVAIQIETWNKQGQEPYNISINISPQFFLNKNFISIVDSVLNKYQIDSSHISFEITENIDLSDIEYTKKVLKALKSRKIRTYIDDFGKGYSSLNYIKAFQFDYLKIDKSFIDNVKSDKIDQAVIDLIKNLSNYIGFKIVAEGVEKQEQLDFLMELGCHEYQGYLLSRPQPLETLQLNNTKKAQ